MPKSDPDPIENESFERRCPSCGDGNSALSTFCARCGNPLPDREAAMQAEADHISYLLSALGSLRARSLLTPTAEHQIRSEYSARREVLLAGIQQARSARLKRAVNRSGTKSDVGPEPSHGAPPIIPELPQRTPGVAEGGPKPEVRGGAPEEKDVPLVESTASSGSDSGRSRHRPGRSVATLSGLRVLLEEHALKIVFAVATLLVLVALRSMFAWEWLGTVAVLLIPAVPVGLTAMFWIFGQKTRAENAWAAVIYHSLAVVLVGVDALVINKYMLMGALGGKLAFLFACLLATVVASALLMRWKEIPYFHLFQTGMQFSLYSVLQLARLGAGAQDFRPEPIWLFGLGSLVYASVCLLVAFAQKRRVTGSESALEVPDRPWVRGWSTWAHLSVVFVVLMSALSTLVEPGVTLHTLAPMAFTAGLIYISGAQLLNDDGMVYGASGFLLVGVGLWLTSPGVRLWPAGGVALLGLGTAATVLAAMNSRRTAAGEEPGGLTRAYRHIAIGTTGFATVLLGLGASALIIGTFGPSYSQQDARIDAGMALFAGIFFVVFALWEEREEYIYATVGSWGCALVCGLAGIQASPGAYGLALVVYGVLLGALAYRLGSVEASSRKMESSSLLRSTSGWGEILALSGQAAVGIGVVIAMGLFFRSDARTAWLWLAGTLTLGAIHYVVAAQRSRVPWAVSAALGCAALGSAVVTWHFLPGTVPVVACFAPYGLVSACVAFYLSIRQGKRASVPQEEVLPSEMPADRKRAIAALWHVPLVGSSLLVIALSLANGVSLLFGDSIPVLRLVIAPLWLAAAVDLMALQRPDQDKLRKFAVGVLCVGGILEVNALCQSYRLPWTATLLDWRIGEWLAGLAWCSWALGQLLRRSTSWEPVADGWVTNGRLTAVAAALSIVLGGTHYGFTYGGNAGHAIADYELLGIELCLTATYFLPVLEAGLRRSERGIGASLGIATGALLVNAMVVERTTLLGGMILTLAMVFTYLGLARRLQEVRVAGWSIGVWVLGYALFVLRRNDYIGHGVALLPADLLWLVGGVFLSWAYMNTAAWGKSSSFTYGSALVATATYLHGLTTVAHVPAEWQPMALLPFVIGLYLLGRRMPPDEDETRGMPLRNTAFLIAFLAPLFSIAVSDGILPFVGIPAAPWKVCLTLLAYGLAFTGLAVDRRTPETVMACSSTLTLAYLNYLLAHTSLLGTPIGSVLPSQRFAFLAVLPGALWLLLGWRLRVRGREDLAAPLLKLTSLLALGSAPVALMTALATPQSLTWGIVTLGWCGALWFGLWRQQKGEMCLHFGTWNLIVAWGLIVYNLLGAEATLIDIYLFPVGLYFMALGHTASEPQKRRAQPFWTMGLLITLTPTFLAYWEHAPFWHTLLLLVECVAAILWGIGHRIRAFVIAGVGFAVAYAASAVTGRLPEAWGTLASLGLGVGLFVLGFYALTHREKTQRWMMAIESRWNAWQAWR